MEESWPIYYQLYLLLKSITISALLITIVITIGWYAIWHLYLSHYELIRVLVGLPSNKKKPTNNQPPRASTNKRVE
ncbi:hypothetical protein PROFUN_05573 [Planoprotostelium fungivorum]|uniref:Uncharacterized protein n=1 Tax=Planoprotostelium fungivorum TaxID=1890364 RepID=A0A2P6N039_9EUKA|nr:hypothetical protein PROFUN_05573 [Planoprotostelium fungivorum]